MIIELILLELGHLWSSWIESVSKRFRQSQIKAAVKANNEMIRFYWNLGKDMDLKKSEYDWGSHFYSRISEDLKKELPEVKSFSPRNLLYMHQFFRLFPDAGITHQVVAQLDSLENTQQPVAQLNEKELIFLIPWGHGAFDSMDEAINSIKNAKEILTGTCGDFGFIIGLHGF